MQSLSLEWKRGRIHISEQCAKVETNFNALAGTAGKNSSKHIAVGMSLKSREQIQWTMI